MDIFTPEKRSEIMSKIRSKNTKPELLAFRYLRKRKIYFQKHYRRAPGSPDIALPRRKIAVFIDGDFWHGYRFSARKAKLRKKYWLDKIQANMRRDRRNKLELKKLGWKVLRVWEHDIKKGGLKRIADFLTEHAKIPL
jgi:DNA mismatch endonuclease (patch repair protein)